MNTLQVLYKYIDLQTNNETNNHINKYWELINTKRFQINQNNYYAIISFYFTDFY